MEFVNIGPTPLCNLSVALTHPGFLTFGAPSSAANNSASSPSPENSSGWPSSVYPVLDDTMSERSVIQHPNCGYVCSLPIGGCVTVEPGETLRLPAWVCGPDTPGEHSIDFLFYYEPTSKVPHIK